MHLSLCNNIRAIITDVVFMDGKLLPLCSYSGMILGKDLQVWYHMQKWKTSNQKYICVIVVNKLYEPAGAYSVG